MRDIDWVQTDFGRKRVIEKMTERQRWLFERYKEHLEPASPASTNKAGAAIALALLLKVAREHGLGAGIEAIK